MKIVNHLDEKLWRGFVDRHPQGNVFHTPEMYSVYGSTKGYRPSLWAALENEEVLALHVPVEITLVKGPFAALTSRAVCFGSILAEDSPRGRQALAKVLDAYNRRKNGTLLFTELRNFADLSPFQDTLADNGYIYQAHENYLIDLDRSPDEILQSFRRETRRVIRQFERRGDLEVIEVSNDDQLTLFYQLLQKTYGWARIPLADYSLFKAAYEQLLPKGMVRFVIVYNHGVPAASDVVLNYKDITYGWYNGVDRTVRPPSSNEYLMWDTMRWGSLHGYKYMDMGGGGKPGEKYGVRDFKEKFNGHIVSYGRNTHVHAPLRLKLSESAYEFLRKGISLLRSARQIQIGRNEVSTS